MSSLVVSGVVTPSGDAIDNKFDMITTLAFQDISDGVNDKTECIWANFMRK